MLYRILTEYPGRQHMPALRGVIMTHGFMNWAEIRADGYWEGNHERSLIIEINTRDPYHKIDALCEAIRKFGDQYCVLLQCIKLESHFI